MTTAPLVRVEDLVVHFPVTAGLLGRVVDHVRAVDGVSFEIQPGETLGLVGESGCGKTTVGRSLLRLIPPTSGRILFDGRDLATLSRSELRVLRRDMQIVFQDPFSSLNPRKTVLDIVGESLEVHGIARGVELERRVVALLERVGIPSAWAGRYPHEFSGGQRQRIGVARAIALDPKLVVCDEAVSALDVSVQAQMINLLIELRREMNLAYLFIAHDLSVVRHISHRVAVMYLGELVETSPSRALFASPAHPYTRALLSAIPVPDPRRHRDRIVLEGDVPTPRHPPPGCRFHTRCPAAVERCRAERPRAVEVESGHRVRCVHAYDLDADADWHRRMGERIEAAEAARRAHAAAMPRPAPAAAVAPAPERERIEERHGFRRRAGLSAAALGAALALLGSALAGALAALVGYLLFPFSDPRARRRAAAAGALGLLTCALAGFGLASLERRSEAASQLAALRAELEARRAATGDYPETLDALGWRLVSVFGDEDPRDPWGRRWLYRRAADGFRLGSLGADGRPGRDDVGNPPGG